MTGLCFVPACTACSLLSAWVLSPCIASLSNFRVRASHLVPLFDRQVASTLIMTTSLLPTGGIALVGAPDSDIGSKDANIMPVQAMQVDMTQDIVDELLESVRRGKSPQIVFGRTPVCVQTCSKALSSSHSLLLGLLIVRVTCLEK